MRAPTMNAQELKRVMSKTTITAGIPTTTAKIASPPAPVARLATRNVTTTTR